MGTVIPSVQQHYETLKRPVVCKEARPHQSAFLSSGASYEPCKSSVRDCPCRYQCLGKRM